MPDALKAAGQSILVIDKNVDALIRIADRHTLIERGRVVWSGTSAELAAAPDVQHRYLGVLTRTPHRDRIPLVTADCFCDVTHLTTVSISPFRNWLVTAVVSYSSTTSGERNG